MGWLSTEAQDVILFVLVMGGIVISALWPVRIKSKDFNS